MVRDSLAGSPIRLVFISAVVLLLRLSAAFGVAHSSTPPIDAFAANKKGQLFRVRHLVANSKVHYDHEGKLQEKWQQGQWTWHSEVEITDVELKAGILRISANRILLNYSRAAHKFTPFRSGYHVQFEIEPSSKDGAIDLDKEWNKAFLGPNEDYAEFIQPYWKPFVDCLDHLSTPNCAYYEKKSWEPEVTNARGKDSGGWQPQYPGVHQVGPGVTSPQIKSRVDPAYTDVARRAGIEGTVLLEAIVDTDGKVQITRIVRPTGWGLEDNAAEALSHWTFEPGRENGQPVKVLLNIEINFAFQHRP